ncbi:uncharacterized protein ATC70_009882 [Mucor velutinosus]|uniref:SPX domain-containing protein n=1 Tax=Mucor velutinosus TaxID=708070 RepID=A0AAN7DRL1_9FUNG|nr:hypothetical protein ATC70_009882 [Mucor velutinosus]
MKFGQCLQQHAFPPWKNEYIQYNSLKYFLKEQQYKPNGGWTVQDENYFAEKLMIDELNKVNGFIYLKTKQIWSIMQQESEQEIRQKITDLIQFIRLNATGFQKILKKHDKHTHFNLQSSIRFRDVPSQFSSHETNLNEILYSYPAITEIASAPQPALEKVTTTKYWIHPDNVTEVQALLLFYLPISEDNASSTVYFDNPHQFPLYSNMLERNESAETIRAKWYGHISNTTDVYFERKIHHESWLHNKGLFVKDRFCLPLPQVNNYLTHGQYPHHTQTNPQLASSIYQSMHQQNLKPTLRCYHHRTTYHQGHSPFRVSLDTKVAFMKEMTAHWHRQDIGEDYPFDHLPRDQVYFFPYAILETKFINTAGADECAPEWLNQLVESQLVYEVPYFSKYLHGASYFFREQLPMLPWWLSEMSVDIRRKPSNAAISTPSTEQHRCTVIEPEYTPDCYAVAVSGRTLPKRSKEYEEYEEDDKRLIRGNMYSNHASSCTMIDDSDIQVVSHNERRELSQSDQEPISAYDKFLNSAIMVKIKHITQDSDDDGVVGKKDANHIGILPWMYRKLMHDKTLYALPPQPKQQIMPKKGKLNNKKIEPKIFFANERTFISWLQFSALLLSVSLGLINFGDHISKGSGAFFIVVAVVLAGYAQLRFQYRAWQIRFRSESRFDDIYGPAVLCFVLVIALIVNLGLRVNQPLPTHPSPFGYNTTDANSTTGLHNHHPYFPNGTMLNKHGKLVPMEEEDEEDINEA